jgi:hypothetical protein
LEFNQNRYQADAEEANGWESIVNNVVDLEGIANDGLGYTVNICGPAKQRRQWKSASNWFCGAKPFLRHPKVNFDKNQNSTANTLEIPCSTEFEVVGESWRATRVSKQFAAAHGSRTVSSADIDAEIGQMFPEYLGDESMLAVDSEKAPPPLQTTVSTTSIDTTVSPTYSPCVSKPGRPPENEAISNLNRL